MNRKKNRLLFLLAALVLMGLAGAWYGYREFNRKHEKVADLKPAFTVTPSEMIKAFEADEQASLTRFAGKVVQIDGMVKSVEPVDAGPVIVVLNDKNSSGSVRVEMDSTEASRARVLLPGKMATLRAACTGYTADDLGLGADVLCNRGIIVKY